MHGWAFSFVEDTFTNATIICDSEEMWNEAFFYKLTNSNSQPPLNNKAFYKPMMACRIKNFAQEY
jgi:hypothetical protein